MRLKRHLEAAQGFINLGMLEEAASELCAIPQELQSEPKVLGMWVSVFCEEKAWEKMRKMALHLTVVDSQEPQWWISLAYATRRVYSIEDARQVLLRAVNIHPQEPMIQFNLGCYACQLGELDTAKNYVLKSVQLNGSFRKLALEDSDLKSIRYELMSALSPEEFA